MTLTKEQILASDDIIRETVDVPEWGGKVIVAAMTGAERDAWEQSLSVDGKVDMTNVRARLVARCMVDESGTPLFSQDDVALLGTKSAVALARVVTAAQRLNGLTGESSKAAGA